MDDSRTGEEKIRDTIRAATPPPRGNGADRADGQEGPRPLHREIPPGEPFPIEALGPVLRPAAEAIHDIIQAPTGLCAQSILGTGALAAQGRANVRLPYGATRPLSDYFVAVGETGERKTAADDLACMPIHKREQQLREEYKQARKGYEGALAAFESEWAAIKNKRTLSVSEKKAKFLELGEKPHAPRFPMLVCGEPTYEGLFRLVREGPRSAGIFSNEGGQLIGGFAMNEDNRLKTAAALSEGWDGKPWKRVRGGDGLIILPNRRVTLNLMVQPLVSIQLLGDPLLRNQGFLSRILVMQPPSAMGTRLSKDPHPESFKALSRYTDRILEILRLPEIGDDEEFPLLLLTPSAVAMWRAFADSIEKQLGPNGALAAIQGLANKAAEHAARIGGGLAILSDAEATEVDVGQLAAGIEITNFYLHEDLRLQAVAQVDTDLQKAADQ